MLYGTLGTVTFTESHIQTIKNFAKSRENRLHIHVKVMEIQLPRNKNLLKRILKKVILFELMKQS